MEVINWISVEESLPQKAGWYLAAINPVNYDKSDIDSINTWRKQFGCTIAWFNPDAIGKWYEPYPHGHGCMDVGERVTHWAELPKVPLL